MKKIVVKVGTSTLTQGTAQLSRRHMLGLVQQIAHLHSLDKEIVLVSSGAVAAGRAALKESSSKQVFASLGQAKLMQTWLELFNLFDLPVGQVLLTRDDFSQNTAQTINALLKHRIVPLVNENDTIATPALCVGDNDNLAALVANVIGADCLILLTDQEGLYTADPRINPDAKLISVVEQVDEALFALAGGSSTGLGTGGMVTKIQAAQRAEALTIIASSARPQVLIDLVAGHQIGTHFL